MSSDVVAFLGGPAAQKRESEFYCKHLYYTERSRRQISDRKSMKFNSLLRFSDREVRKKASAMIRK